MKTVIFGIIILIIMSLLQGYGDLSEGKSLEKDSRKVLEQLVAVLNGHDAGQMAVLFTEDYQSIQPLHPERNFMGRRRVKENWTRMFEQVPDFSATLLRSAVNCEWVFSEWYWKGKRAGGEPFEMKGVIIFEVRDSLITQARLYMEAVE